MQSGEMFHSSQSAISHFSGSKVLLYTQTINFLLGTIVCTQANRSLACVASVSLGLSAGMKHLSLLRAPQKAKNASNGRKNLRKRLLRRLIALSLSCTGNILPVRPSRSVNKKLLTVTIIGRWIRCTVSLFINGSVTWELKYQLYS